MFAKFDDLGEKGLRQELKHSEIEHAFDPSSLDLNYEHIFFLPEVNFKNNAIPVASEKVGIKYSPEFGRHVVALKDIKPGNGSFVLKVKERCLIPKLPSSLTV